MKTSKVLLGEAASMFEEIVAVDGCPVCPPIERGLKRTEHLGDCKLEGLVEELREREAFEASKAPIDLGRLRGVRDILAAEIPIKVDPAVPAGEVHVEGPVCSGRGRRVLGRGIGDLLADKPLDNCRAATEPQS